MSNQSTFPDETNSNAIKPDHGFFDQVGGYHESGTGTDPNGDFCGECSNTDCSQCPVWFQNKEN